MPSHVAMPPAMPDAGPWVEGVMERIYAEGDRITRFFVVFHVAIGLLLAPFYDTWLMAVVVGGLAAAMFFAAAWLAPGTLVTRMVAGISLQAFVALHIYQLHGLPEMHFFFFSAFTMLIAYQDWRAPWPGAFLIIGQHIWFAVLENSGIEMNFFEGPVEFWKLFFHFGIALMHVGVCSYWATRLRRNTLREAWDQQQLELARQRAESGALAKSAFLATMSHEIRTPMNGVLGTMALLEHTSLDDEQREYVRIARRSGEGLLGVIDDVLDYSKLEAGRMVAEDLPFDLRVLLDDVHALLLAQARERGLAFSADVAPGSTVLLSGDNRRLRQILLNLAGNALKFTQAGFVRISAVTSVEAAGGLQLQLQVVDSGIGIEADAVPRLFAEFTQADETTTRRFGGTGLGLAISRRLARLLGGDITLASTHGVGTTFTVTVPVRAASPLAPAMPVTLTRRPSTDVVRVLLVEDNPVNQLVATRLLQREGCDVAVVGNGREAVEACAAQSFDLVLMDCHMPVMDGFEATRRIREAAVPVRIVALTASVLDADRERCLAAGMDAVLAKPIVPSALMQVVRAETGGRDAA